MALKLGMVVDTRERMVYMIMPLIHMTLTLMQGHTGSGEEQNRH